MTYSNRLRHWAVASQVPKGAIVRLLPKMQRIVIKRFRRRSDTDGHLRFLQQHIPDGTFIVAFDVTIKPDAKQFNTK